MKNIYILIVIVLIVLGVFYFINGSEPKVPNSETGAAVSKVALKSVTNSASALLANAKVITWETSDYPKEVGVNINLLKMTSATPRSFEIVRTIVKDTPNDGEETWTPAKGEDADNMYVEVTCSSAYLFTGGCQSSGEIMKVNQ